MKKPHRISSQVWLTGTTATLAALANEQACQATHHASSPAISLREELSSQRFAFHREHVLGTSFELLVNALRPEQAGLCEQQVLAEIERLRLILSTYDSSSEINRVRAGAPVISPELNSLLADYDTWTARTGGAIQVNMGEVIKLWKGAQAELPSELALQTAMAQPRAYNVDALGKGFIIDRAVAVARRFAPGGLLNIGGDIRTWGEEHWTIGIANPFAPAENAPALTRFNLRGGAVATSGDYSRFMTHDGRRYSHIIDPRILRPASGIRSASFVAADCVTANALATAATILGLDEAVRLAKMFGAWDYLLVDHQGRIESSIALPNNPASITAHMSELKPAADNPPVPAKPKLPVAPADGPAWPTNFEVSVTLNLKSPPGGRARRPYVAVWVEDSKKTLVRTITVWGSDWRWLRELNTWWKAGDHYTDNFARSITRATRAPGKYVIAWDGLNDQKQPVPQGEYRVFVEINREHGRHLTESVTIQCGVEAKSVEIRATPESEAGAVEYGLKAK
jgi:thiamine biosynthesis lipoprotein ApbE